MLEKSVVGGSIPVSIPGSLPGSIAGSILDVFKDDIPNLDLDLQICSAGNFFGSAVAYIYILNLFLNFKK